jgi:DNA repair protein RadD
MQLRDYQTRSIDNLYSWFDAGNAGNPCIVLPTGSGKSHVIAGFCQDVLTKWPETRILMLTHVKELIEQNAEKMLAHWPSAPLGIYSASIGSKVLGEPITFAGIQSIRTKAKDIGHVDLVLVDECHLINHKDEGGYRRLLGELRAINQHLRVIGLTATPYRLGHGLITDKPAIFDDLIEPVSIEELIFKGHLAPLRSKITSLRLDTTGVHKRGGEFIESELFKAVDTKDNNEKAVREIIQLAGDRKAWLLFCSGVDHAEKIAAILNENNIPAGCVIGSTSKKDREQMIADFKSGKLRALTNANVLTTGFDYPDIDLIAMLRPTMSASLYMQMAGRGMRPKSHTDHCLVLDFAGVVQTHGPITAVRPPRKGSDGTGEAPVKVCEACGELCHLSAKECTCCGAPFPVREPKRLKLHDVDIMGLEGVKMNVSNWHWRKHLSRASGKEMLAVTYYGDLSDPPVTDYLPITHGGYAGEKALSQLVTMAKKSEAPHGIFDTSDIERIAANMNIARPPASIDYRQEGKFYKVVKVQW